MKSYYLVIAMMLLMIIPLESRADSNAWVLVDNFQSNNLSLSENWHIKDVQNQTEPFVANPQVAEIKIEKHTKNKYYLKKAAAEGIVGNRKALSYLKLPSAVKVGQTYTFFTRIMVEKFPNNHSFGLSNVGPNVIDKLAYNAFEPMLRVTDKTESNGSKNTGALMVIKSSKQGKALYQNVINAKTKQSAKPLIEGIWYDVWYVINNASYDDGGQRYSVYLQGGEFPQQQKVYENAEFRMKRETDIRYFVTISNTGPIKQAYGNGGLAYDDIYMTEGIHLDQPIK